MAFLKNRRVNVPMLDVQGDEATIEIGRDDVTMGEMEEATEEPVAPWTMPSDPDAPQSRKVKLPKTKWAES